MQDSSMIWPSSHESFGENIWQVLYTKIVVSCCADGCNNRFGECNDLGIMYFQLFPGLEGTDPGSLKRHDSKYSRMLLQFCIR